MPLEKNKLYRRPDVLALTGYSSMSLERRMKSGDFPRPVKTGPRTVAWRGDAILKWMDGLEVDNTKSSMKDY